MNKLKYILVAFVLLCGVSTRAAEPYSANYPVLTPEVRAQILCAETYTGGEDSTLSEGENIVVTFNNKSSKIYRVGFETMPNKTDWKEPVLTNLLDSADKLKSDDNVSTFALGNMRIFRGTALKDNTFIFFSARMFVDTSGEDWKLRANWGDGASVEDPGYSVDRGHRGKVGDEAFDAGIEILKFCLVDGQPEIIGTVDSGYVIKLEESSNLINWSTVDVRATGLFSTRRKDRVEKMGTYRPPPPLEEKPARYFRLRAG